MGNGGCSVSHAQPGDSVSTEALAEQKGVSRIPQFVGIGLSHFSFSRRGSLWTFGAACRGVSLIQDI